MAQAAGRQIPAKLIGYNVFLENSATSLGAGDITLPSLEAMVETMSGAGIQGEIEVPTPGYFGSLVVGIAWRTIDRAAISMISSAVHSLDIRGSQQIFDSTIPGMRNEEVKVTIKAMGKNLDLGTFTSNAPTDGSSELEVIYLKIVLGGDKVLELDKLNYIFYVNGKDEMTDIRQQLGMQ